MNGVFYYVIIYLRSLLYRYIQFLQSRYSTAEFIYKIENRKLKQMYVIKKYKYISFIFNSYIDIFYE